MATSSPLVSRLIWELFVGKLSRFWPIKHKSHGQSRSA
jgi:hypothetical protein